MKENEDKNENEENNSLIIDNSNENILNNSISNNNQNNISFIKNEEEEEKDNEKQKLIDLSTINLDEVELGSKILCPEKDCYSNAIILIDPIFFKVNSDCGKHNKKLDIIEYVYLSGKAKENKEKCSICEKTYEELLKGKIKLYKCYCEKNVCEECKEKHLNESKDKKEIHNMISFKKKDYLCCCDTKEKKYINFCFDCKKNICILCNEKHKEHKRKKFEDINELDKNKKELLKKQIGEQNKKIMKIEKILDEWLERAKIFIKIIKKKLELYNQINNILINQFNITKSYFEMFKNIEYIRLDFDKNFNDLLESENDYKKQNLIIFKIFNENEKEYKKKNNKNEEKVLNNLVIKNNYIMNGMVNNICELKKEELIIINIRNENQEEIYIYQNTKNEIIFLFSQTENNRILNLIELKNGNLLILKENEIKIYKINKNQKGLNKIQIIETQPHECFKGVKELINGNLITISSYSKEIKGKKITFWEKSLFNGYYERDNKRKIEEINENPFDILEMNKNDFLIFFENNNIYIFDSNSGELKKN